MKRAAPASLRTRSRARDLSVSTSRRPAHEAQNESGTVPKRDPAILLPITRGGDDCAPQDARSIAPRIAAQSKLRMCNVQKRDQTLVVDRALKRNIDHKKPIDIHGTAATTKSPINNARR